MNVTDRITLNLSGDNRLTRVYSKQGDINSRVIECNFEYNGMPYTLPTGALARVWLQKPDGKQVVNDSSVSGDKVVIALTQQMLAFAGDAQCEIQLYHTDSMLSSAVFTVVVSPSSGSRAIVESSPQYEAFENGLLHISQSLADAAQAVKDAGAATKEANDAASRADTATGKANTAASAATNAASKADTATGKADTATAAAEVAAATALEAADDAAHLPRINGVEHWELWDRDSDEYTDSGQPSRGRKGDVMFAVFYIDTSDMSLNTALPDEEYNGPQFRLTEDGALEVLYNAAN